MLTLVSWNINSVRIRLELIRAMVERLQPDVLCLQETKTEDAFFPADGLRAMGFEHQWFVGQKSYNGVAILSKLPLSDLSAEPMVGRDDKRHISARLPDGTWLHNFYVPAGGDVPDPEQNPKFDHKLRFVDGMIDWSRGLGKNPDAAVIMGDFNIAPHEHDVWSSKQLAKVVSHTPPERERLIKLQESLGWIDTHRHFTPMDQKLYSWWSYRSPNWHAADKGRRLDHLWVTPRQESRLASIEVLKDARGWENPSDHAPIALRLKD